jgi:putative endonuclease
MCFLYILRTSSNTLYIGVTESLDQRINTHNSGKGAEWIKVHRDARLVYSESHATLGSARKREIQLKKWSRAKKEALIAGDLAMLRNLSRGQHRSCLYHAFAAESPNNTKHQERFRFVRGRFFSCYGERLATINPARRKTIAAENRQ